MIIGKKGTAAVVDPEHVGLFRLLVLRRALRSEVHEVPTRRDRAARAVCMREFRFRGDAAQVLDQLEQKIKTDFPGALEQQDAGRAMAAADATA
jgi:hypothetical protein